MLAGLFLFAALNRMTASLWRSGMVAALFLIHPLHVESVAWVAERKDILSGLFWMVGIWCYARYAERPGPIRYFLVILSFTAGLFSKPMMVTFPFVLLLLDRWPLGRSTDGKTSWLRLVGEKIPLFLLSAAESVITFLVQKESDAVSSLSAISLWDRLLNATFSYVSYLGKAFWPSDLAIFYPYHAPPPFQTLISSITILLLITVISILLHKRQPYLLTGWLWYLGTLVPVIGIVQVGSQAMADRYTYLPLVGISIMVVWNFKELSDRFSAREAIRGFVSVVVIVVLISLTRIQVGYWQDTTTLFRRALQITERNFIAHQILADDMAKKGDSAVAESHYREALRIKPAFKQSYNSLGHLLMIQGKNDEAGRLFEEALRIDPAFVPALKNLGDVRMRQGRIDDAIHLYGKAVLFCKEDAELLNNYGVALFLKGEKKEAVLYVRAALRQKPNYIEAQDNLQKILEKGQTSQRKDEKNPVPPK
jgi:Tfp pilus assembly protein PilF